MRLFVLIYSCCRLFIFQSLDLSCFLVYQTESVEHNPRFIVCPFNDLIFKFMFKLIWNLFCRLKANYIYVVFVNTLFPEKNNEYWLDLKKCGFMWIPFFMLSKCTTFEHNLHISNDRLFLCFMYIHNRCYNCERRKKTIHLWLKCVNNPWYSKAVVAFGVAGYTVWLSNWHLKGR